MPLMSRRLDEDDEDILPQRRAAEREMTLGTGAILGIFFGLVVLLGAFFGFGYKLGSSTSKSITPAGTSDAPATAAATPSTNFNTFKPSAGSQVMPGSGTAPGIVVRDGGGPVLTAPTGGPARSTQPVAAPATLAAAPTAANPPLGLTRSASPSPTVAPAAMVSAPMPPVSANGTFVVQVAAVSHQEDADLLVNALHARGYSVNARNEAGDRLVHIQVGPFGTKKDAETMKARLTADGYNAYIK